MKSTPSRPSTGLLTANRGDRCAPLRGRVTKTIASCCIARTLVLATEGLEPILIQVDSANGMVEETLGIISTMNGISCPVVTFCRGKVAGPGLIIAAHGLKGYRVAAPGARFSFGGFEVASRRRGAGSEKSFFPLLAEILAKDTGVEEAELLRWFEQGAEFSANEAVRKGLIDAVAATPLFPPSTQG